MIYPGFYLLGAIKPNVVIDACTFFSSAAGTSFTITFNVQYLFPPLVFISSPGTNYSATITEITSSSFKIIGSSNAMVMIDYIAIGIVISSTNNISSTPLSCSLTMTDGSRSPIYLPKVALANAIIDIGNVPNNLGTTTNSLDSSATCPKYVLSTYSYRQSSSQPPVASSTPTPSCRNNSTTAPFLNITSNARTTIFLSVESKASSGTSHWNIANIAPCDIVPTQLSFNFSLARNIYSSTNPTVNVKYLAIGPTCLSSSLPSLSSVPGIVGRNLVIDYGIAPVYNSNTGSCYFNFTFASIPPLVLISIVTNVNVVVSIRYGSITTSGFTYDISGTSTSCSGTVMYMAIGPISC